LVITIYQSPITCIFATPSLLTAQLLAGVMGWVILWRERYDGYGVPGGLPLIVRFFDFTSPSPLGEGRVRCHWLHCEMENPRPRQLCFDHQTSQLADHLTNNPKSMRCLSRIFFCTSFFISFRDYTVKKSPAIFRLVIFYLF